LIISVAVQKLCLTSNYLFFLNLNIYLHFLSSFFELLDRLYIPQESNSDILNKKIILLNIFDRNALLFRRIQILFSHKSFPLQ